MKRGLGVDAYPLDSRGTVRFRRGIELIEVDIVTRKHNTLRGTVGIGY